MGSPLHALADQVPHRVELLRRGRTVVHPQDPTPHRVVADEVEGVHADPVRRPHRKLIGHFRAATPVHTERDGCDPLEQKRACVTTMVRVELGVRVHVDKARCHDQAGRVDRVRGGDPGSGGVTDEGDPAPRHSYIRLDGRTPRSVEYGTVEQQEVGRTLRGCA